MTHAITAAVLRQAHGPFQIETLSLREPYDDEVLVRIEATGMCHTDLLVWSRQAATPLPVVLGHEGSGIIAAVGSQVADLAVGDPVVISFATCARCASCIVGEPAYCTEYGRLNLGGFGADGRVATQTLSCEPVHDHFFGQSSFATLALARARNVVKVDNDRPLDLLGPLGCGLQTGAGCVLNSLRVRPGESFAAFGAGGVGLAAVMAARVAGAGPIIAIDMVPSRLATALEVGATHVLDAREPGVIERIRDITRGGVDASLECTGLVEVARQAIDALAHRGRCGLIGASPAGSEVSFAVRDLKMSGRTIRGITQGDSVPRQFIPLLLRLFRRGQFPFDRLVRFYNLADINLAVEDSLSGRVIKPIIRMPRA
jgi:aryl-alcohol dehydrogenase